MPAQPPPVPGSVLAAFAVEGTAPQPLPGGEGRSVRVGDVVLKPVDDSVEAAWTAGVLDRVPERGFRVARPRRSRDGRWVVDGWTASSWLPGVAAPQGRWGEVLSAGRAFHAALRGEPRPAFLDARTHRWAVADRVAWGEADVEPVPAVRPLLRRLTGLLRPVAGASQVVHGDLSGNVLLAPGRPPAVIDVSPYWRPAAYADAVVAVDGLLWYAAGPSLLRLAAGAGPDFGQLLLRALVFRLVALGESLREAGGDASAELARFDAAARLVIAG